MNTKTIMPVFLLFFILFSGCAAEVEYWITRMEEAEKKSAEKTAETKTGKTQAEVTEQSFATPPASVTPVAPPVSWPPKEQTPTTQQSVQPNIQEPTPVTPDISSPEPTTVQQQADMSKETTFTINIKGGEKYIGEILLDEIPFKTTRGIVNVKPGKMVSFSSGKIQMKDGTNINGIIDHDTIKIKTGLLGELEIKTSEIESITR